MDPISILGAVGGALHLVRHVCETVQWMHRVVVSLKQSSRTLKMIHLECEIYGDSIKSIGQWLKDNQSTKGLQKQLRTTHNAITLVKVSMANLLRDLKTISNGSGNGQEKLTIKSFKNCITVRYQWFEQIMKTHLTELRCHSQTLQLTLQVIQLTKCSELPSEQGQGTPEKLEQKTRSLEKRLLLRHFITKALEIRRAEVAAEEERRSQAMKEFIRLRPMSPSIHPSIQSEDQLQTPGLLSGVEQARHKAVAEQENTPEDLLSDDIEDLIDISNDFQTQPNQARTSNFRGFQDLHGLDDFWMPQQIVPEIASKAEGDSQDQHAVLVEISERKHPQSLQLASQHQTSNLSTPDIDPQPQITNNVLKQNYQESPQAGSPVPAEKVLNLNLPESSQTGSPVPADNMSKSNHPESPQAGSPVTADNMSKPNHLESPQASSPLPPPSSGMADVNAQRMMIGHVFDTSPTTTATPSIFSHTSTLSGTSAFSAPGTFTEQSLQDINKPDGDGFPWIVLAARDGDEAQVKRLIVSGADLQAVHTTTQRSALCEASLHGYSNVVNLLIGEGCRPDHADAEFYTALHHACHKGYLAVAKSLIAANADIDASGPLEQTPLHLAAQVPHRNVVMLLLQHKANVNARDEDSRTPLHFSAAQGNAEMCIYLLENGAQLDNRDSQSRTALQLACEGGHYDTAEALLNRSNLKATDLTFLTAFFAAVEHGHVRIAESFLSRGLDLQKLNKNDLYKPATLAAKSGSPDMLELMKRANCNLKAKDDCDWNALHFATQLGHWRLIEPLVANDVSVRAVTKMKDTPLILAVKGGHFTATEILLRSKGISVAVEDGQAQQPIHHVTRAGSLAIFNLLISNGAKIAVENAFGWHPIHIAVAYGHTTLVDRLIERFAKVEEKLGSSDVKKNQTHKLVEDGCWAEAMWPYPGSRPLHLACEYGHYQIACSLISKGAKLEASCSEGWRPLHHAAFNGSSALVELLLNAGCYPWAETEEGKTPQALQFRTAGSPIPQEEKDKVRLLLQEAMDRTTKQPEPKGFKVGLKKGRTVEEKNNLIRAVTSSIEMVAKSHKQSTKTRRPRQAHPPLLHSNTAPAALPTVQQSAQTAKPSQFSHSERPVSSASNRPSIIKCESNLETVAKIDLPVTNILIPHPTEPSGSKLEETASITTLVPETVTALVLQHSMGPMQSLPALSGSLMKDRFKLKRASTFGVDMSKQGLEKISSGLGSSKQGLEKISTYSLDVSKQGYKKVSSYGQNVSKQGLEKMKKINYGQELSKQGMEKMKNIKVKREKKPREQETDDGKKPTKQETDDGKKPMKQETDDGNSSKSRLRFSSKIMRNTKSSKSITTNIPDASQSSPAQVPGQSGENQADGVEPVSQESDEDLPEGSDGASSMGGFSMGGFDTYVDDGGDAF